MSQTTTNAKVYVYNLSIRFRGFLGILITFVMIVVTLASLIIDLLDPTRTATSGDLPPPWGSLFGVFVSVILFALFSNMYPSLQITDRGIYVQVFLLGWSFVPWSDVLDVHDSLIGGSHTQIVVVRRLTPIHRLFGLIYGFTLKPAFRVSRSLEEYQEAIKYIRKRGKY